MYKQGKLFRLRLEGLLEQAQGKHRRVANWIGCDGTTITDWLKKSDAELARVQARFLDTVERVSKERGVEVSKEQPRILWDCSLPYHLNVNLSIPRPLDPPPPPDSLGTTIAGIRVRSPFGAGPSVVTSTASRIRFLARSGCDFFIYKTVREAAYLGHDSPNILSCPDAAIDLREPETGLVVRDVGPGFQPTKGMMNRFGMPSPAPQDWKPDFREALAALDPGQLLIISIVGTVYPGQGPSKLIESFCRTALHATEAGALVIELNFSCPNCMSKEGSVYADPRLAGSICRAVANAVPHAKLLIKSGFLDRKCLEALVGATGEHVAGYSGINTLSREVLRRRHDGTLVPAYGTPGVRAGISGAPIRLFALQWTEDLVDILAKAGAADKSVIAMGGLVTPQDVSQMLALGVSAVAGTTAFIEDADFGVQVREHLARTDSDLVQVELERELKRTHDLWWRALNRFGGIDNNQIWATANLVWTQHVEALRNSFARRHLPWRPADRMTEEEFHRQIAQRLNRGQGNLL